jgi:hypothetical protein
MSCLHFHHILTFTGEGGPAIGFPQLHVLDPFMRIQEQTKSLMDAVTAKSYTLPLDIASQVTDGDASLIKMATIPA